MKIEYSCTMYTVQYERTYGTYNHVDRYGPNISR